jgi:hypothetical protein
VAALAGAKRPDAKARASRANGRLGGRPPTNAAPRDPLDCHMRNVRSLLIGYAVIAMLTGWPVVLATVAGVTASLYGCTLNEAGVHPCVVAGRDVGPTLYSMGMTAWFLIALIPLGAIAATGWTTGWLIMSAIRKRRAASPELPAQTVRRAGGE